jgi:hypothetical protein
VITLYLILFSCAGSCVEFETSGQALAYFTSFDACEAARKKYGTNHQYDNLWIDGPGDLPGTSRSHEGAP